MALKVAQGHQSDAIQLAVYHVLLVVRSNNTTTLHRFRDITTFTAYVNARNLENSFSFYRAYLS